MFNLRNPFYDRNKQNNDMKKIFTLLTLALACVMQLSAQKLQITNGGEVVDCSTVGVITYTNAIQMGNNLFPPPAAPKQITFISYYLSFKTRRNRKAGFLMGQGKTYKEAMDEVQMVVEGVYSAKAAYKLSQKYGVEMPIVSVVNRLLFEDLNAEEGMKMLLTRNRTSESTRLAWDNEQA